MNHRIRWVDASSGLIYTIAGNGVNGFSGDEGPALTAEISFPVSVAVDQSGRVYFADENNNRIRVLTPVASQFPSVQAGSATLNSHTFARHSSY